MAGEREREKRKRKKPKRNSPCPPPLPSSPPPLPSPSSAAQVSSVQSGLGAKLLVLTDSPECELRQEPAYTCLGTFMYVLKQTLTLKISHLSYMYLSEHKMSKTLKGGVAIFQACSVTYRSASPPMGGPSSTPKQLHGWSRRWTRNLTRFRPGGMQAEICMIVSARQRGPGGRGVGYV